MTEQPTDATDPLLPTGSRLLHVGPQKTGTTAIQVAMAEARAAMQEHGAYYPRGDHRRRQAGWALGLPGGPRDTSIRHWEELVAEVRDAGPVRVCVSDENFARAEAPVVSRIVDDLGGDEPHVIAVARRLDRFLPSQWQERVKAGIGASFEDWLTDVLDDQSTSWERWNVWMGHDTEALVARWADKVGPERITIVIADESDRRQLTDLFEAMLGLPPGLLELHPDRSNQGFGLVEVELLRRLRVVFERNGWTMQDYHRLVRRGVRRRIGARPVAAPGPRHAPLPGWALDWIRERSDRRADAIPDLGVRVIGDPDWLRVPTDMVVEPIVVDRLTVPLDLAVEAIETAVERQRATAPRQAGSRRPASDLSGRELLRLAVGRARRRLTRS
jgi:hypothetical protein